MTEEKITPGPWRINSRAQFCIENQDGRSVASTAGYVRINDGGVSYNENIANAKLISLAPEMYEVLQIIVDLHEGTKRTTAARLKIGLSMAADAAKEVLDKMESEK